VLSLGAFAAPAFAQSSVGVTVSPQFTNTGTTTFTFTITGQGQATDLPVAHVYLGGGQCECAPWSNVSVTRTTGGATGNAIAQGSQNNGAGYAVEFDGSIGYGQSVTVAATYTNPFAGCDSQDTFNANGQDSQMQSISVNGGSRSVSWEDYSGCILEFLNQPSDATVGKPMAPITVEIAGQYCDDSCYTYSTDYSGPVTLSLQQSTNSSNAALGGTTTVNAYNGAATFRNVTINKPASGEVLVATAGDMQGYESAATGETSNSFDSNDAEVSCTQPSGPQQTCNTTVSSSSGNSSLAITAFGDPNHPNTATLVENINDGNGAGDTCAGMAVPDANFYQYFIDSQFWSKTGVYTLKPPLSALIGTTITALTSNEQLCYASPTDFVQRGGGNAPPETLPDGTSGFSGLLPNCGTAGATVCVSNRAFRVDLSSPSLFDLILTTQTPEFIAGDPWQRCC
jgi:hypothetical protein